MAANKDIKLSFGSMADLQRQLANGAAQNFKFGSAILPANSPETNRILAMPAVQAGIGASTTNGNASTKIAGRALSPILGGGGGRAWGGNENSGLSFGDNISRFLSSQETADTGVPSRTLPISAEFGVSTPSLSGGQSLTNSMQSPTLSPMGGGSGSAMDFSKQLQTIIQNKMFPGNQQIQNVGKVGIAGQLDLQQMLLNDPNFAGLNYQQAQRVMAMENQGFSNMYLGASKALEGRQQMARDFMAQGMDAWKADQAAREADKDRQLSILQLQLSAPVGTMFNYGGQTYQGLKPMDSKDTQWIKDGDKQYRVNGDGTVTPLSSIISGQSSAPLFENQPAPRWHEGNLRECGEQFNNLTDGPKVQDEWGSKIGLVSHWDNPQIGNGLVMPMGGKGVDGFPIRGHIETVIGYNPETGEIHTVSANHNGHYKKTFETYTIESLNASFPHTTDANGNFIPSWGFTDNTLKGLYQADVDAFNTLLKDREPLDNTKRDQIESIVGSIKEIMDAVKDPGALFGAWPTGFEASVGLGAQKFIPSFIRETFLGADNEGFIPGTPAETFRVASDALVDKIVLPNLEYLKGAMSDKDIIFIRNSATKLRDSSNEKAYINELNRLYSRFYDVLHPGQAPSDLLDAEKLGRGKLSEAWHTIFGEKESAADAILKKYNIDPNQFK